MLMISIMMIMNCKRDYKYRSSMNIHSLRFLMAIYRHLCTPSNRTTSFPCLQQRTETTQTHWCPRYAGTAAFFSKDFCKIFGDDPEQRTRESSLSQRQYCTFPLAQCICCDYGSRRPEFSTSALTLLIPAAPPGDPYYHRLYLPSNHLACTSVDTFGKVE